MLNSEENICGFINYTKYKKKYVLIIWRDTCILKDIACWKGKCLYLIPKNNG
jgi:hypothetical protein